MNKSVFGYLMRSFKIILAYPKIIIYFALMSLIYFGFFLKFDLAKIIFFSITVVFGLFIFPIIYGRYIEIINFEIHESFWAIFQKHWLNYYLVRLVIALPTILFFLLRTTLNWSNVKQLQYIIDISIEVMAIYIIPLVFLTQKRLHSISLGLKCIIGNFNYSWLLIFLTLISFILMNLFQDYGMIIFNGNLFITATIGFILSFVLIVLDFSIFITASLILKEELF